MVTVVIILVVILLCLVIYIIIREFHNDKYSKVLMSWDKQLINPRTRGAFGERILLDIIKSMNLIEGIHYEIQQTNEETGKRPDLTLKLPNSFKVNVDSKFPLDNYIKFIEGDSSAEGVFIKNVKDCLREIVSKDYIDVASGTLDFAICFVPNDALASYILNNAEIADYCLKNKIALVGPQALFVVLNIIYSMHDYVNLDKTLLEKLVEIEKFKKYYEDYKLDFDKLNKSFNGLQSTLQSITNVRVKNLDGIIEKLK